MPQGKKSFGKKCLSALFGAAVLGMTAGVAPALAQGTGMGGSLDTNFRHPYLASESQEDVGVLLVLAMDASGSMSADEWDIQVRATANALTSPQVRSAIRCKTGEQSVAIAVVGFATNAEVLLGWTDFRPQSCTGDDPEFDQKLEMLAAQIARLERHESGSTHIGGALEYALHVYQNAPWQPTERRVLDLSGDGTSNGGPPMEPARQALINYGVTINGIAIVNETPTLPEYYASQMVSRGGIVSEDGRSISSDGLVWEVASTLQSRNNDAMTLFDLGRRLETALTHKIAMETSGIYDLNEFNRMVQQAALAEQGEAPGMLRPASYTNDNAPTTPQQPEEPRERVAVANNGGGKRLAMLALR